MLLQELDHTNTEKSFKCHKVPYSLLTQEEKLLQKKPMGKKSAGLETTNLPFTMYYSVQHFLDFEAIQILKFNIFQRHVQITLSVFFPCMDRNSCQRSIHIFLPPRQEVLLLVSRFIIFQFLNTSSSYTILYYIRVVYSQETTERS